MLIPILMQNNVLFLQNLDFQRIVKLDFVLFNTGLL